MFRKREKLAEDAEAARQTRAIEIIRDHVEPVTAFERKVAAIVRSRYVDPFKQLAVAKTLHEIISILDREVLGSVDQTCAATGSTADPSDGVQTLAKGTTQPLLLNENAPCIKRRGEDTYDDVLRKKSVTKKLRDVAASATAPSYGDVLYLPLPPPVFAMVPNPAPIRHRAIETTACRSPHASLFDFETLAFNNRTIHRYYTDTDFAAYLYQNLLFSLDASDVSQLANDRSWQARLAVLLWRTKLNQLCAFAAFYENRVTCDGVEHDTSFVPYYDVKAIMPLSRNRSVCGDELKRKWIGDEDTNDGMRENSETSDGYDRESVLYYHRDFDPSSTAKVPLRHMGLFMVFPFKAGYYIRPDGRPVFLNVKPYRRESVRLLMERVCGMDSLESIVDSLSRQFDCDDALSYAVHSRDLVRLGVALLVLRRMVGDKLSIGSFTIQLPTEMNVLEWNHTWCHVAATVLPRGVSEGFCVEKQLRIITDIADRASSKLDISLLCSPFRLIECQLEPIYRRLTTDAQRYAFYTLLMQDYPNAMYWRARKRLKPSFVTPSNAKGTNDDGSVFGAPLQKHLLTLTTKYAPNCRPYVDSVVTDRMNTYAEPLIRPTDVSGPVESHCHQLSSPERYEFVNEQLNSLVSTGNTILTPQQFAAYVSMYL